MVVSDAVRLRDWVWVREEGWVRDFVGELPDGVRLSAALMLDGSWVAFAEGDALPVGSVALERVSTLRGVAQ